jgi:hypothetical protein
MDTDHGEQAWVDANAARVSDVLGSPDVQEALYRLLGGEPDPERRREALARDVARLRLQWRPGSSAASPSHTPAQQSPAPTENPEPDHPA